MTKRMLIVVLAGLLLVAVFSCGKKEEPAPQPQPLETEETPAPAPEPVPELTPEPAPAPAPTYDTAIAYELQIVSLRDEARVTLEQEIFANRGIQTKISSVTKDGETYYRLRLDRLFSEGDARKLGEEMKAKYGSITEYWVEKVK